jgi:hypothetical protein
MFKNAGMNAMKSTCLFPNTLFPLTSALVLLLLAGCGTSSELVVLPPVAPDAPAPHVPTGLGALQVYSARVPAVTDVNYQEFFADDDFGGNLFPVEPAHSDYTIYTESGQLFDHVRNASNPDDPLPATVSLPKGDYKIEALEKNVNPGDIPVLVPITIQPGRMTRVYLDID